MPETEKPIQPKKKHLTCRFCGLPNFDLNQKTCFNCGREYQKEPPSTISASEPAPI